MLTLGQIENSEYNLLGAMSEDDFLQALDLSGPNDKKKLFRKMQNQTRVATNEIIGQIDPLKSLQIDPPFEGTKLECLKSG
jgi:hypothetical protein